MIAPKFEVLAIDSDAIVEQQSLQKTLYGVYAQAFPADRESSRLQAIFFAMYKPEQYDTFVAAYAGEIVGLAMLDNLEGTESPSYTDRFLEIFAVKQQDAGYGSIFLTLLEATLAEAGTRRITLFPSKRATRFYHRHGYRRVSQKDLSLAHKLAPVNTA